MKAAGILFLAPSGKVLLMRRAARPDQDADCQGCWSVPGGGVEEGETAEVAARREIMEETGQPDIGPLTPWTRRVKDDVDFTTFLCRAEDEFTPTLNDEHDAWQWTNKAFALTSTALHPGLYISLQRFGMDELGVAKAMVAGELSSPQMYKNLMLIAIRITGTGASYRPALNEYVWRDPSLYMNQEFLERCNGLPVIFRHPTKAMLDTQEFRDRIVGTIFVPYAKQAEQEIWGIAKILDMAAAELLTHFEMSTSPGVLCMGAKIPGEGDDHLLLEDKPSLLDHIAILIPETETVIAPGTDDGEGPAEKVVDSGAGVWDKGAGRNGVESVDAEDFVHPEVANQIDTIFNAVMNREIDELCARLN